MEDNLSVGMLEISESVDSQLETILEDALNAHSATKNAPPYEETPLSIIQRDDDDKPVAGLTAHIVWNWLYVDMLWVSEELRGQGVGTALIKAAEEEAVQRGCHSAYLWTQDWQGTGFYPKLGYKEFVVKQDFPIGFTRTGFMKLLKKEAS